MQLTELAAAEKDMPHGVQRAPLEAKRTPAPVINLRIDGLTEHTALIVSE